MLWAYRTTARSTTGESPFFLAFGAEAVVPVEIGLPNNRTSNYRSGQNQDELRTNLDLLEEVRETSQVRIAAYQQRVARFYNSRVKERRFRVGDLVLRRNVREKKDKIASTFNPNWIGPYKVIKTVRTGTYWLEDMQGRALPHPWNAEHLRIYYQ